MRAFSLIFKQIAGETENEKKKKQKY